MSPCSAPECAQAVLTVDLGALQDNWRFLRDRSDGPECAAVVKADAYGVGLREAVSALAAAGCKTFFVAQVDEALCARRSLQHCGADGRVFLLNGFAAQQDAAAACVSADVIPMIGAEADEEIWRREARAARKRLPIALMFDTGMNRLGYAWTSAADVARRLVAASDVDVVLTASHFVSSDAPDDSVNAAQIERFAEVRAAFPTTPASLANSSGLFLAARPLYDLVRPGYALYGGNPTPGSPNPMKPVVGLRARILQIRDVPAGQSVGYDAQWTARRPTRLAALGVGYADGLPRNSMATDKKPGGQAMLGGARCSFAGRVSMDIVMIDVTDASPRDAIPGAWVDLLSRDITIDDLGARAQTIGYEILTNLGRRYSRVYI